MFPNTVDDGAKPKVLLKACPGDTQYGAFTRGKNILCKNFGVKEGEGVCSKGAYFRELMVHTYTKQSFVIELSFLKTLFAVLKVLENLNDFSELFLHLLNDHKKISFSFMGTVSGSGLNYRFH